VAVPGVVCHIGLARHLGALQTDGHRGGMGADPPIAHHGGVHRNFWSGGRLAVGRRRALRIDGFCRHAALEPVQHCAERGVEQLGEQRQPDQQGVLSAFGGARSRCGHGFYGFSHQLRALSGYDAVVPVPAAAASAVVTGVHALGPGSQPWARPVDDRPERQVPRLPVHHPFCGAVWLVRVARGLQFRPGARRLAHLVQPQSGGGRHRRLSLVPAGRTAVFAGCVGEPGRNRAYAVVGRCAVSQNGAGFCRFDLKGETKCACTSFIM